jgi:hypothetical protein
MPRCKADGIQLPGMLSKAWDMIVQVQPVLNADHPVPKSAMQLMADTSNVELTT